MARALVLGTASLPALTGGTNSQKRLEIDYFGENTQPEEDLNGRAEWTFSWQTLEELLRCASADSKSREGRSRTGQYGALRSGDGLNREE